MLLLENLWQDTRIAWRALTKNRGATALSVLSIALGIGLTTALFSVADALMFRPFPFRQPDRLCELSSLGDDGRPLRYGWPDYQNMARALDGTAELAAVHDEGYLLAKDDGYDLVFGQAATPNLFSLLGVQAALGQATLGETDGRPYTVLSHRLWQKRFGGDHAIVGRTIVVNQRPFVVAGVLPAEFTGLKRFVPSDLWIGTGALFSFPGKQREQQQRNYNFDTVLRLPPGANQAELATRLDAAIRSNGLRAPAPTGTAGTRLLASFALSWQEKLAKAAGLLPVLALLLFVACANVAQMRLAQTEQRKKELGVRLALGSSPAALSRLLLVETAWVSVAGAALGVWLTRGVLQWLTAVISVNFPILDFGIRLDWRVLSFTLGATLVVLLFASFVPVRHAFRLNLLDGLKSAQGTSRVNTRWQTFLIAGQTAASIVLFGLAVLFLQSWQNAAARRPGFDPAKAMAVIRVEGRRPNDRTTWAIQACERLAGLPGVRDATFARVLPLNILEGGAKARVELTEQAPLNVRCNSVGPGYFSLMGTRLVTGRGIDASDRATSAPVVVVSRQLARQAFGERNAVGESLKIDGTLREIVGVAEDAPAKDLHEESPHYLYLPYAQSARGGITLLVETATLPETLIPAIQQELKRFDPDVLIVSTTTLRQHMANALFPDRMLATSTTWLGALGFLLTAAGLFGVIQYTVNRRTREIGVRMALGAGSGVIRRLVLGESLRIVRWGVLAGLVLLGLSAHAVRSVLLDVSPLDPRTFAVSAVAAVTIALLAAWLPARRATRVNPVEALRAE